MKEDGPKEERIVLAYSFSGPFKSLSKAVLEAKGRKECQNGAKKIFAVRKIIFLFLKEERVSEAKADEEEIFLVFEFLSCKNEDEARKMAKEDCKFLNGEAKIFVVTQEVRWPNS